MKKIAAAIAILGIMLTAGMSLANERALADYGHFVITDKGGILVYNIEATVLDADVCSLVELKNGMRVSITGKRTLGLMEGSQIRFAGFLHFDKLEDCRRGPMVEVLYLEIKID